MYSSLLIILSIILTGTLVYSLSSLRKDKVNYLGESFGEGSNRECAEIVKYCVAKGSSDYAKFGHYSNIELKMGEILDYMNQIVIATDEYYGDSKELLNGNSKLSWGITYDICYATIIGLSNIQEVDIKQCLRNLYDIDKAMSNQDSIIKRKIDIIERAADFVISDEHHTSNLVSVIEYIQYENNMKLSKYKKNFSNGVDIATSLIHLTHYVNIGHSLKSMEENVDAICYLTLQYVESRFSEEQCLTEINFTSFKKIIEPKALKILKSSTCRMLLTSV